MRSGVYLEIKSIHILPPQPAEGATDFSVYAQIFIGEVGDDGRDSFDVRCLSPSMLAEAYGPEAWDDEEALPGGRVIPLAGVWIMKSWSYLAFQDAAQRLVSACNPGPDFGSVASRIGRFAPWEFDYRFDNQTNAAAGLPEPPPFWHDD